MQHGHTRRAVLLAAVASAGCVGRGERPLAVTTDLTGRPFRYHARCCDWEGTTITGFLPAVFALLGSTISRPIELLDAAGMAPIHCSMTPPGPEAVPLLGGFITLVLPQEGSPERVVVPAGFDNDALRASLGRVTDATPHQLLGAPTPPEAGVGVVTDWVTAYRWSHRGRGRLVGEAAAPIGAFDPPIATLAPVAITLTCDDPDLTRTLREGVEQLRGDGRLAMVREEYFTTAGRPRRL